MRREVHPEELEKLYSATDMVRADCGGCHGCSACCQGMGSSVILDPYDMYQLEKGLKIGPEALIGQGFLELNLADGLILPNLKMAGETERCVFLNEEGRCRIHGFRPGLCRLFPLGRYYEEAGGFRYYLQLYECPKPVKTKVKVSKWLGIPEIGRYEAFTLTWHEFLMGCRKTADTADREGKEPQLRRQIAMYLLSSFYMKPYEASDDFYAQFSCRMEKACSDLAAVLVE